MMSKPRFVSGLCMAIFILMAFGQMARAQSYFDVSSCFNELLQQKIDYTSTEQLKLATLAQISESTYEAFKRDAKFAGEYGFISGSANYSDFSDKRRAYFSLRKLDLEYYKAISTSSRVLGPAAYGVITNCIQQLASKADGFHYLYTVDDAKSASVQFFWRPPLNFQGIDLVKVEDSTLVNAVVVNGDSYKGHLYDHSWYKKTPRIGIASPVILLARADVDTVIRISMVTEPPVNTGFITIPPVPKPIPPPKIKVTYENAPFVFPFYKKQGTHIGHGNPLCTDCDNYEKVIDVPGEVVSVACTFGPGSHNNTSYCGVVGENQAKWAYFTNDGNEQAMTITVVYKKKIETCVENCGP
jgi:hypothetical protein